MPNIFSLLVNLAGLCVDLYEESSSCFVRKDGGRGWERGSPESMRMPIIPRELVSNARYVMEAIAAEWQTKIVHVQLLRVVVLPLKT